MQYLEKAMEVLSSLENTNVVGQIMAHNDVMMEELAETSGAVPHYLEIVRKFEGEVTKSAANTTINTLFSPPRPSPPSPPQGSFSYPKPPWLQHKAKECKTSLFRKRPTLSRRPQMTTRYLDRQPQDRHADWRCHRCHLLGHIR